MKDTREYLEYQKLKLDIEYLAKRNRELDKQDIIFQSDLDIKEQEKSLLRKKKKIIHFTFLFGLAGFVASAIKIFEFIKELMQ